MKSQVLITVSGPDQDGLINAMTQKTRALSGVWLANKIVHLDGQMTGLLKLLIDTDQLEAFKQSMNDFSEHQFSYQALPVSTHQPAELTKLAIEGDDRAGLTTDITEILAEHGVKIVHFESQRYPVVGLDVCVYEAHLELMLPTSVSLDRLQERLSELNANLTVRSL